MEPFSLRRRASSRITLRVASDGSLHVTAPWFAPRSLIETVIFEKAEWIQRHRSRLSPTETPGLSVWGQPCSVVVESPGRRPRVVFDPSLSRVTVRVPPTWTTVQVQRALDHWEAQRVEEALRRLVPLWSSRMGLSVDRWTVKRMRSRWGSCQPATRSLVFNAHLAALAPECLEYVVVHELVHLWEPSHNARFHALVHTWLPEAEAARRRLKTGVPTFAFVAPGNPSKPGATGESSAPGR